MIRKNRKVVWGERGRYAQAAKFMGIDIREVKDFIWASRLCKAQIQAERLAKRLAKAGELLANGPNKAEILIRKPAEFAVLHFEVFDSFIVFVAVGIRIGSNEPEWPESFADLNGLSS